MKRRFYVLAFAFIAFFSFTTAGVAQGKQAKYFTLLVMVWV